jgi:PhzF family phenazine biosynthesis protein
MSCLYSRVDGFAFDATVGGNAAGVVVNGEAHLQERLKIAAAINFSETVFVDNIDHVNNRVTLRYWTPGEEVDMCGHATIAALGFLSEKGLIAKGEGTVSLLCGECKFVSDDHRLTR